MKYAQGWKENRRRLIPAGTWAFVGLVAILWIAMLVMTWGLFWEVSHHEYPQLFPSNVAVFPGTSGF